MLQIDNKFNERGIFKKPFFRKYPQIIQIYFQVSKSNIPEDVKKLFNRAKKLYENFKKRILIKKVMKYLYI